MHTNTYLTINYFVACISRIVQQFHVHEHTQTHMHIQLWCVVTNNSLIQRDVVIDIDERVSTQIKIKEKECNFTALYCLIWYLKQAFTHTYV